MAESSNGARLRAAAATAVDAVVHRGRSLDDALLAAEKDIAAGERSLLRALCYGTLRFYWRLDAEAQAFLRQPLRPRDGVIRALLAIGIFQLTDTRIGEHAVVSLTVEAARLLRRPRMAPMVNAVLRSFLRGDRQAPDGGREEVAHNHPQWLIDRIRADWPDDWTRILDANNRQAPMWLRVNRRHLTAEAYLERLAAVREADPADVGTIEPGLGQGIRLAEPWSVEELPGFADGDVSVQDGAAQLAAPWLLEGGGARRVLDACAAPGGKTAHLLELMDPDAALTAVDSDPDRVGRISENLARLGLRATVLAADASKPQEWWDSAPFDRILLDAPCSATGVIRRHPDIKHLRRRNDIKALAGQQLALLEGLWPLLAPGGRLLYVTCSVLKAENDAVVEKFLGARGDAAVNIVLPDRNIRAVMCQTSFGFQILPGALELDGFFFACLGKAS